MEPLKKGTRMRWTRRSFLGAAAGSPWLVEQEGELILGGRRGRGAPALTPAQQTPTGKDFRFTTRGNTLYAIVMDWPGAEATITSLADGKAPGRVARVELLGRPGPLTFSQTPKASRCRCRRRRRTRWRLH
jgi:hypothetical protein